MMDSIDNTKEEKIETPELYYPYCRSCGHIFYDYHKRTLEECKKLYLKCHWCAEEDGEY